MTIWSWLTSPCLFGHAADLLYDRDSKGVAHWRCPRCHAVVKRVIGHPAKRTARRPVVRVEREKIIRAEGRFQ